MPRNPTKVFNLSAKLGYEGISEKISYYNGKVFKSVLFKDFMIGYPVYFFARTKLTGSSIHSRKKKAKKK